MNFCANDYPQAETGVSEIDALFQNKRRQPQLNETFIERLAMIYSAKADIPHHRQYPSVSRSSAIFSLGGVVATGKFELKACKRREHDLHLESSNIKVSYSQVVTPDHKQHFRFAASNGERLILKNYKDRDTAATLGRTIQSYCESHTVSRIFSCAVVELGGYLRRVQEKNQTSCRCGDLGGFHNHGTLWYLLERSV